MSTAAPPQPRPVEPPPAAAVDYLNVSYGVARGC